MGKIASYGKQKNKSFGKVPRGDLGISLEKSQYHVIRDFEIWQMVAKNRYSPYHRTWGKLQYREASIKNIQDIS